MILCLLFFIVLSKIECVTLYFKQIFIKNFCYGIEVSTNKIESNDKQFPIWVLKVCKFCLNEQELLSHGVVSLPCIQKETLNYPKTKE